MQAKEKLLLAMEALLAKGTDIQSVEMRFAAEIAARGGTDMIIEWLRGGMKEDKRQLLRLIKRTLPGTRH